jgi:hypothetical protein
VKTIVDSRVVTLAVQKQDERWPVRLLLRLGSGKLVQASEQIDLE